MIASMIAVALCLAFAWPSAAGDTGVLVIPLAAMGEEDWQPLAFRNIERETTYEIASDPDGHPAYRAISQCSASAMLLRLPMDFDLARTPRLAWRWRIEKGLENHDEQNEEGDDFAARVYVLFRFDAKGASLWRRLRNEMGERLFGAEIPGKALNFVWGSRVSRGETWISPVERDVRLLALESGSNNSASRPWREAVVDLAADAGRVFDPAPSSQPYAVGLMTDSDDTCKEATAWFSNFRLLGPELVAPTRTRAEPSTSTR